jgi:NDP-sugar pyrophosphorylase family protein
MGELTRDRPKVLLEIQGRAMLWYQLRWLQRNGITDVVLPLGHFGEQIERYVTELEDFPTLRIWCVTTGEDSSISERLCQIRNRLPGQGDFLLINGDTLTDFDTAPMFDLHRRTGAMVTTTAMTIKSTPGLMQLQGDLVIKFVRGQPIDSMSYQNTDYVIHGGHSIVNRYALDQLQAHHSDDFEQRFYDSWAQRDALRCYQPPGWFIPVDSEKDIAIAETMALSLS